MTTATRLNPPDSVKLPTHKALCPQCNGDKSIDTYTKNFFDPTQTKQVDCDNPNCEDGLVEVPAIAFVVYDKVNECWLGYDPDEDDLEENQIFQVYNQHEGDHAEYERWQDAEENVNAYCKKFGLQLSDLSFDDALQVDPTL